MKIYLISYPRSGNTAARYLIELLTKRPTNGLIGERNAKDNLQEPLIYKDSDDYVVHKKHDFRGVKSTDMVIFIVRDYLEAIIRHNERPRGIALHQMIMYIDSWYSLLDDYDKHEGPKMLLYYDAILKIASKESRQIYRNPQSSGPHYHKAKLGKDVAEELDQYAREQYSELYEKYIR